MKISHLNNDKNLYLLNVKKTQESEAENWVLFRVWKRLWKQ